MEFTPQIAGIVENQAEVVETPVPTSKVFDFKGKLIDFDKNYLALSLEGLKQIILQLGKTYVAARKNPDTGVLEHGAWWMDMGTVSVSLSDNGDKQTYESVHADFVPYYDNRTGNIGDLPVDFYDNGIVFNNRFVGGFFIQGFANTHAWSSSASITMTPAEYDQFIVLFDTWVANKLNLSQSGTSYISAKKYPVNYKIYSK